MRVQEDQRTIATQAAEFTKLTADVGRHTAEIAVLKEDRMALREQAAEIATLKEQVARMARLQVQPAPVLAIVD